MPRRVGLIILVILLTTFSGTYSTRAQQQTHTVQPGENLFRIALRYNMTVETLAAANSIGDPTHVIVGQVLVIPGAGNTPPVQPPADQQPSQPAVPPAPPTESTNYTVQPGDTLNIISRKFGVTWIDLVNANRITDPNHIEPGQQIVIPGTNPQPQPVDPAPVPVATAIPPTAVPAQPQPNGTKTYVVQPGEGLAAIGRKFNVSWPEIAGANNISDPNRIFAGMTLVIPEPGVFTTMENSVGVPPGPVQITQPGKYIRVVLREQRVYAYENGQLLRTTLASTGMPGTPTVQGQYNVYVKYRAQTMTGPGYYLPGVPYVMYFYQGYGLHGTYWHNNFGHPMSHGCVNLPTPEAEWFYNWAEIGTPVHVVWSQ